MGVIWAPGVKLRLLALVVGVIPVNTELSCWAHSLSQEPASSDFLKPFTYKL